MRVRYIMPQNHRQGAGRSSTNNCEFPAVAALDQRGKLLSGAQSIHQDDSFPLKTLLLHCAGITRLKSLRNLPGMYYML